MARTAHREKKLANKSSRAKLSPWAVDADGKAIVGKPRKKPYYTTIARGLLLGYIKRPSGAGSWVSRKQIGYSESGLPKHRIQTLGLADDLDRADDEKVLDYEQARRKAGAATERPSALTVREAVRRYVENIRATKGERAAYDAMTKLRKPVLCENADGTPREGRRGLGDVLLAELTLAQLEDWRNGLLRSDPKDPDVRRKSQDTANRTMASFKAALNAAVKEDEARGERVPAAWRLLKAFEDVGRPREGNFSENDVRLLLRTAREQDPFFADLLEGAVHTGSRPPQDLAQLNAEDFNPGEATVAIHKGKTKARVAYLTPEGAAFFKRVAQGKKPGDVLLPKADGERWGKSHHIRPMKLALDAAGLAGSLYLLRHSYVRRARAAGIPDSAIAENCGTSIDMLEQTYGRRTSQEQRALIHRMGSLMGSVSA